ALIVSDATDRGSLLIPTANLAAGAAAILGCLHRARRDAATRLGWLILALAMALSSAAPLETVVAAWRGAARPVFPDSGNWISFLAVPVGGIALLCFPFSPQAAGPRT